MGMEASLVAVLRTQCPRVFPDVAPAGTPAPYITYQHIGGESLRYLDGQACSLRHSMVQLNAWADTRVAALALSRAVEDALCATPAATFTARPVAEPIGDDEEDTHRRGCLQDFHIWGPR
jgi:hypothetical protein